MANPVRAILGLLFASGLPLAADEIQIVPQAVAFMGINTTGVIRPLVNYMVGATPWQTTTNNPLVFDSAALLQAQGLENPFLQALSNDLGAGWSFGFNTTAVIADNTFQVHTYEPQGPPPPAANNDALTAAGLCPGNNCVGSEFFFNYVPEGDDPTANVHWVQILFDNYLLNGDRVPPFFEIDNNEGTVPYYDVPFTANATGFLDIPFVTGPGQQTIFDALTLLVTGPAPNTPGRLTIYGGIEWGWSNQPAPEPSSWILLATVLLIAGRLVRAAKRQTATQTASSRCVTIASGSGSATHPGGG
jgi:hypothetical protein